MAGPTLIDWPENTKLALSGEARSLRLPVQLHNASDDSLEIDGVDLIAVRLAGGGPSLRLDPTPYRLSVAGRQSTQARIRLRLDPTTAPGHYTGEIGIAGLRRPVDIEVLERIDLALSPSPVVIDTGDGLAQSVALTLENRGNVPIVVDLSGRYPIGEETPMAGVPAPAEGTERLSRILDRLIRAEPRPVLEAVGEVDLAMPEGPVRLDPGTATTMALSVRLPEHLSPTARHHVFAPLYTADLHLVIVTAAKPRPGRRRARSPKGDAE